MHGQISLWMANLEILAAAALSLAVMWLVLGRKTGRKTSVKLASLEPLLTPYRRGDYNAALAATEALRNGPMRQSYHFYRGALLGQLGRLAEAETELKQGVAMADAAELAAQNRGVAFVEQARKLAALSNQELGNCYLDQGRYGEAQNCFQTSLHHWPGHGSTHRALAELSLRRGDPAAALEWAGMSVQEERGSVPAPSISRAGEKARALARDAKNSNLGESLATLAWALAAARQDVSEAESSIVQAAELTQGQPACSAAQVHLHAGYAYAALGQRARAEPYWKEAACLDPHGRSGRAAQLALTDPAAITASK